jgi:hypothetical protein
MTDVFRCAKLAGHELVVWTVRCLTRTVAAEPK